MDREYILLIPILFPVLCGVCAALISRVSLSRPILRVCLFVSLMLEAAVVFLCSGTDGSLLICRMTPEVTLLLHADELSRIFAYLVVIIWLLAGIYASSYMSGDPHVYRFFAFYLMAEGMIVAAALSGNLITFYMFFELMTMSSFALVMHDMTHSAILAGLKYIFYSVAGAFMVLFGIFMLTPLGLLKPFVPGGVLDLSAASVNPVILSVSAFLMIIGFGTKAGSFPMHAWLPSAHPEAPAPASAVLSGIITKTGVLGIIRVIWYSLGPDIIKGTWVQNTWMTLSLITVFMGSMMAFREPLFKKRLAYSTVSQVSYILFGLSVLNPTAFTGAISHMVFHALIKTTLFLAAGSLIHHTGQTRADSFRGIGRKMPVTMWCYTIVSLGLIGIPPLSGFVSKWYLAAGALASGLEPFSWVGCVVLLISALLTAGYLLPVTVHGFFPGRGHADADRPESEHEEKNNEKPDEASPYEYIPMIIMSAATLLIGIWPGPLLKLIESIASVLF